MTKFGILMIGYAGLALAPGCATDTAAAPSDDTQAATSELTGEPGATPRGLGAFNILQMVNTPLCLRPQGGSTVPGALLELHACDASAAIDNWELRNVSGRIAIINAATGNCIYNNAAVPLVNMARPIDVESCFLSDKPGVFASNALWKQHFPAAGASSFETEIQLRDTNFCLDMPNGQPFDGATFWNFRCNSTAAQQFEVK
jgi:hypothetical protein